MAAKPPAAASPLPVTALNGPDIIDTAAPAPPSMPLPAPPTLASRWSGFYAGINFGGGWTEGTSASTCINSITNTSSGCTLLNESGPNTAGLLGGGQVGYLAPVHLGKDMPPLILGAEFDLEGSGISGNQTVRAPIPLVGFPPCTTCNFSAHQSLDSLVSLRARIGVPVGDVLFYGTGGVMIGGVKTNQSLTFTNSGANYTATVNKTLNGGTVGGGIEYHLPGMPWTARLEGLYYDLGKIRTVAGPMNDAFVNFSNTKTFIFRGGIVRLALNLQLGDLGQ